MDRNLQTVISNINLDQLTRGTRPTQDFCGNNKAAWLDLEKAWEYVYSKKEYFFALDFVHSRKAVAIASF